MPIGYARAKYQSNNALRGTENLHHRGHRNSQREITEEISGIYARFLSISAFFETSSPLWRSSVRLWGLCG
jgi:hypothetical protein